MRALLVEDLDVIRRVIEADLVGLGWHVVSVRNGLEAMATLGEGEFDLVFTDLVMPEMDGYELCEEIRLHPKHRELPIIVLSSHMEADYVMEALRCGADDYIVKPASPVVYERIARRVMADV